MKELRRLGHDDITEDRQEDEIYEGDGSGDDQEETLGSHNNSFLSLRNTSFQEAPTEKTSQVINTFLSNTI